MTHEEHEPMTVDQTFEPEITHFIVNWLKEAGSIHGENTINLIDCLERMVDDIVCAILLSKSSREALETVVVLIAENVDKINEALIRDYEDGIIKL